MKNFIKQYGCNPDNTLNILMFIMDKCNYTCEYCYNRKPRHLIGADLKKFLLYVQDIRNKLPQRPLNISLIGGEPTLHESMVWFCDELIKLGNVTVEILTNLHKPFDYYYELLNKGIMIASSWHSKQDDLLNFDFVEKIKMIPQKFIDNYQVEVRIMMENNNWENSKKVFKELYTKCKNIMELSLLLTNDGKPYKYTDRQLQEYKNFLMLLKGNKDYVMVTYENGEQKKIMSQDMYLDMNVNYHLWKCNAGLDYIYVHVNGDVYNCQSYYEHGLKPMYNIINNNGTYMQNMHKPCICRVDYCSCDFQIHKERILNCNE